MNLIADEYNLKILMIDHNGGRIDKVYSFYIHMNFGNEKKHLLHIPTVVLTGDAEYVLIKYDTEKIIATYKLRGMK